MTNFESTQTREISKRELFTLFQNDVFSVIERIHAEGEALRPKNGGEVLIQENGITLRAPSDRLGKHATVYIIEVDKGGTSFSCVLRNQPKDAEDYQKAVEKAPVIKQYLPELYGIQDGWVIMERIEGIESAIKEKLKEDEFRASFLKNCAETFYSLAANDVAINDVNFIKGHNVIAKEDGSFKFIEQTSLAPEQYEKLDYTLAESVCQRIFSYLEKNAHSKTIEDDMEIFDFEFQFLSYLFTKISPEDLYIRYRTVLPTHEYYRGSFNSYLINKEFWEGRNFKELSDEGYISLPSFEKPPLPWAGDRRGNQFSEQSGWKLNPDLITAIKNNDIDSFVEILKAKTTKVPLEETEENIVVLK